MLCVAGDEISYYYFIDRDWIAYELTALVCWFVIESPFVVDGLG